MRYHQAAIIIVSVLLWTAAIKPIAAASQVVWSDEAENSARPSGTRFGTAVVDDATASGGKAVRIPYDAGANGWSMVYSAPRIEMRGQVLFTFWLRAENLPPLTPGFMVTLVAHDTQTGEWAYHRQTRVYGVNLQTRGYRPITLALDVPWTAETYGPEVILQWDAPPQDVTPVVYPDKSEISVPALDAPRVLKVSPTKIRYQPKETVTVMTSPVNPTAAAIERSLVGEEVRIVDAHHLSGYDMKLKMVPIRKGRSQVYVDFPETAVELFDHNVVYLCGADLTALTLRQKNMLAEYVRRGGGLIVFGGRKALDRAGLKGSLLENALPVTGGNGLPPLVSLPGGAPLKPSAPHPVTKFAEFESSPVCFFVHDLQARPEAQTIITVGDKPGIAVGTCGKGRVAVIGMTCFGSPAEDQTPFWQWRSWVLLLRDLAWWAAGQDEHFVDGSAR
jgi:hypothetical protein